MSFLLENYEMEQRWDIGRKAGKYELKFRKSGRTLCNLYPKEGQFGVLVIFGKKERELFEADKESYSEVVKHEYDQAKIFHDGKWVLFPVKKAAQVSEMANLIRLKRKPNKKKTK